MFTVPDSTPARVAAQALLDVTEGGFTTPELIRRLNEYVGSATDTNDIPGLIKICYEPELLADLDNRARAVLRTGTAPSVDTPGDTNVQQGFKRRGDSDNQAFSIKHTGGFSSASEAETIVSINGTGTSPGTSAHVDCSIIQVFANRLAPASRDMGALTLFMNAIPTLEISRAVPFIDVVLVQEGDHFTNNRLTSLSLGQFLLGNQTIPDGTMQRTILGANDAQVVSENARDPEFERTERAADGTETTTRSPIATAGMELFTSPQTLVNADEDYQELDAFSASREAQLVRQSPVIDKFRPLMSLKSLSFNVVGTGGMMSYKTGKMSVVLHDRSRLAEISALVRPARFGTTHLLIEYGWSHPDSPAQSGFAALNRDNLFGSLIGALRVKEKYQIVNSSFDFDDSGQVNIELQLSMLANRSLQRAQIGLGIDNVPAFQQVQHLTNLIQELRSRIPSATAQAVFGESDVLGSLTNPSGAVTPLSADVVRQIRNLTALRTTGASPDLRALGQALSDLMGSSGGRAGRLRSEMRTAITQRINNLSRTSDPFLVPGVPNGRHENTANVTGADFVSLGKIFTSFALQPAAASGHYKDVQIIFYNFNEKASYMANRNIATFPIKKSDFEAVLRRELDQLINMPVESFINFVGTYFISDPAAKAYGFNSAYGELPTDESEDSLRQLNNRYKDDEAALFNLQQSVLQHAYGTEDADLEFKHPTVSVVLESVPVRAGGTPDQTILRIHVFDSQATSHATLQGFLESASSRTLGLLNTTALAVQQTLGRTTQENTVARRDYDNAISTAIAAGLIEQYPAAPSGGAAGTTPDSRTRQRYVLRGGFGRLKNFIMRTVPSVRYGEGSSGILSAKVTSMNDSALSTVNMLRQGRSPENPIGTREQGVPLQVSPVECTLETIGCPLWSFGQQIFLDMGTGTTIDAIYGVTGVDHTIEQGNFKSTVKLTPMNSYARYTSLVTNLENALVAINGNITGDPINIPEPGRIVPARRRTGRGAASGGGGSGGGSGGTAVSGSEGAPRARTVGGDRAEALVRGSLYALGGSAPNYWPGAAAAREEGERESAAISAAILRGNEINEELRTIERDIARYRENIRRAEAEGHGPYYASNVRRVRGENEPQIRDAEERRRRLENERARL